MEYINRRIAEELNNSDAENFFDRMSEKLFSGLSLNRGGIEAWNIACLQTKGHMPLNEADYNKFDQTAEIAIWLLEISSELSNLE